MAQQELIGKLGLDTTEFQRAIKTALQGVQEFGKRMQSVGKSMSAYLTAPLAGFAALSVKAFDTQIQAENRLKAAIQASGGAVDENFAKYSAFASQLQSISTVGDEATLAIIATAESMGVSGDAAIRAAKNAVSLEKALGISASSAIRMTAALEQGDATMLTRYIPALRGVDNESEKVRIAQESLANMFGQVTAEAQSGLGPLTQLKNQFGDFMEVIGGIVLEGLQPMFNMLKSAMAALQSIDKSTLKWMVTIGALVAAIGPLLAGLGFLVTTVLPAIAAGFAAISLPVLGAIAAIAAVVAAVVYLADNWDAVKERVSDWGWWKNMLISMLQFLVKYNPFGMVIKQMNMLLRFMDMAEIPDPFNQMAESLEQLKGETKEYKHEMGSFMDAVKNAGKFAVEGFKRVVGVTSEAKTGIEDLNNAASGGGAGGGGIARVATEIETIAPRIVKAGAAMKPALDGVKLKYVQFSNEFTESALAFNARIDSIFNDAIVGGIGNFGTAIGEALGSGTNVLKAVGASLLGTLGSLLSQLGRMAIATGLAIEGIRKSLATLNPVAAIAAGVALLALAGFVSGKARSLSGGMGGGVPAFARGGMTTGPTLAMVGDNRSGKEAIIPFERMGQFLNMAGAGNGSKVEVVGVLRGEDLYLSSQNYINRQNRRLG